MTPQGWICNSSICMTRRGMRPTGIAIFEAQQKGFLSVGHFVQVQRRPLTCLHLHIISIPTYLATALQCTVLLSLVGR